MNVYGSFFVGADGAAGVVGAGVVLDGAAGVVLDGAAGVVGAGCIPSVFLTSDLGASSCLVVNFSGLSFFCFSARYNAVGKVINIPINNAKIACRFLVNNFNDRLK